LGAPQEVVELVAKYERGIEQYRAATFRETELREQFLNVLFRALGWDVTNEQGDHELYKDVVLEDSIHIDGHAKAPDYAFRLGGQRMFFLEAKPPAKNILGDAQFAYQIRRYGWSAKLVLSVLSDFEELAVYDTQVQPKATSDRSHTARVAYWTYRDYATKWDEISGLLSRDAVRKGSLLRFAKSVKGKRGTAPVDVAFLREIESWREMLAKNIALRNQGVGARDLNRAVQRIIDRIVFLRICEARGIEDEGLLRDAAVGKGACGRLVALFERADDRYNSGLFHFKREKGRGVDSLDTVTPCLTIDDKVIRDIVMGLYYPTSPYEFAVLPADILGQVYEQFLGKVIRLTVGHQAKVEDKPEVRKAGGVYYTPSYVVEHIVKRTLDAQLAGMTPKRADRLKILDPACGSGSFLIVAYQHLLNWYTQQYEADGPSKHKGKLFRDRDGAWRLTTAERKRVLLNNIYGVDIDPQAVEVTKLSLALKVLEGETRETLGKTMSMFTERALPDMDSNIKCGNSIVGSDFYDTQARLFLAEEERERVNVFDWDAAFPEAAAAGGFDVVLGNPPYVYRNATEGELREYFLRHYRSTEGNFELYKFFLEKAVALCKERTGRVGMIVSATFLVQATFERLRTLILSESTLHSLAPLGPGVFAGATVDTAIIILTRGKASESHQVEVVAPLRPEELETTGESMVLQQRFMRNPKQVIDYRLSDDGAALVERLLAEFPTLETAFEIGVGINTGFIRDELVAESHLDDRYHPMVPGSGVARYGSVTTNGWIMYDREYVRARGSRGRTLPEERFFNQPKILVVRTRNLSLPRRIVATLDESEAYNLNRLTNIISRDGSNLLGLLGLLNSQLYQWLFSTRFYDYEIKPVYLRGCPVANTSDTELVDLVQTRLKASSELASAAGSGRVGALKAHIAALERAIDDRAAALYGLGVDERAMVADSAAACV